MELASWMESAEAGLRGITRDPASILLAYATLQTAMLAGMIRCRASLGRLIFSPLAAAALTLLGALGLGLAAALLSSLGVARGGLLHFALGIVLLAGMGYSCGRKLACRDDGAVHSRGTVLADASWLGRTPRSRRAWQRAAERLTPGARAAITLAGVPIPARDETKHFKLIGTTGTGKSTAIREILVMALARGDRAVIADPDGTYASRFYDQARGDVILNPFDDRSRRWDPFAEIDTTYDIEQLARALIPDHAGPDRSWREYARTFFAAIVGQIRNSRGAQTAELYRLLVAAGRDELAVLVQGTPAQPFLAEHNGRMFDSIRSVASSALGALQYIACQQAPAFGVRRWVAPRPQAGSQGQPPGSGGVLFIPYRAGQIAALRSIVSAWMRLAIFEAMDCPEGDQRLWFVVDELDALGQIDGLKDALARLRKFGGRCVLGFQSIAQVSSTYGAGEAQTIVENCGNTLILRCSGSEQGGTSRFASQLIGQREVLRTPISRSRRATEFFDSTTTRGSHLGIEPAVMASQIERLPDLHGYLKLASRPEWLQVVLDASARLACGARRRSSKHR